MSCCAHSPVLGSVAPVADPTIAFGSWGAWGVAAQWEGGDEWKWPESKKLASLDPRLRNKVTALMQRMRTLGYKPFLFYGWRGLSTQAALQAGGTSWVSFSFHNAVDAEGNPAALGADIVDADVWWGAKDAAAQAKADDFFRVLGREAKAMGLYWGGDWSKPDPAHVQLMPNSALAAVKAQSLPLLERAQTQASSLRDEVLQALEAGRQTASRSKVGRLSPLLVLAGGLALVGGIAYTVTRRSR